jgi:hypothetical protein
MTDRDVEIDTNLRQRAIDAVESFVRDKGTPVTRAQIAGLMQIAVNEPHVLGDFAGKQKERARKRADDLKEGGLKDLLEAQIDFWERVKLLSEGKGAKCPWSLLQAREAAIPEERKLEMLPPGTALSPTQREERERKKRELEAWKHEWDVAHYGGFFRHFCAHYLYRLPPSEN